MFSTWTITSHSIPKTAKGYIFFFFLIKIYLFTIVTFKQNTQAEKKQLNIENVSRIIITACIHIHTPKKKRKKQMLHDSYSGWQEKKKEFNDNTTKKVHWAKNHWGVKCKVKCRNKDVLGSVHVIKQPAQLKLYALYELKSSIDGTLIEHAFIITNPVVLKSSEISLPVSFINASLLLWKEGIVWQKRPEN